MGPLKGDVAAVGSHTQTRGKKTSKKDKHNVTNLNKKSKNRAALIGEAAGRRLYCTVDPQ